MVQPNELLAPGRLGILCLDDYRRFGQYGLRGVGGWGDLSLNNLFMARGGIGATVWTALPFGVQQAAAFVAGVTQFCFTVGAEAPAHLHRPSAFMATRRLLDLTQQGFFFQGPIILLGEGMPRTQKKIEKSAERTEDGNQKASENGGEDVRGACPNIAPGPDNQADPEGDQQAAEDSDNPLQTYADLIRSFSGMQQRLRLLRKIHCSTQVNIDRLS